MFSPENIFFTEKPFTQKSRILFTRKIKPPLHTKNLNKKVTKPLCKKNQVTSRMKKKSCNLSDSVREKNHATSPHTKIMQPLHAQNQTNFFF